MIYTYDINTDFVSPEPDLVSLKKSILDSTILSTQVLVNISGTGDIISVEFVGTLTSEEATELDLLITNTPPKQPHYFIHETVMLIPEDVQVKNGVDWQDFGGVIVAPSHFSAPLEKIKAQVTGQYRVEGTGAEVALLERGDWNGVGSQELINPPHPLADTAGTWVPFTAYSNTLVRDGFWSYIFRARKDSTSNFYLRYLTLSLIEERDP